MSTSVKITWPRDANGDSFSILTWIETLSEAEQKEWYDATTIHDRMVEDAIAAGDAVRNVSSVDWKTTDIWRDYIAKYLTDEIKAVEKKYWDRYLSVVGLTIDDVIQRVE